MSQPNEITLPVDLLNNGTTTDEVYEHFSSYPTRSIYNGPDHTLAKANTMTLYRTLPKRSGLFLGAAKTAIKFSIDRVVKDAEGNDVIKPDIIEVSMSTPVGVTAAQTLENRQRVIAALDHAFSADLADELQI